MNNEKNISIIPHSNKNNSFMSGKKSIYEYFEKSSNKSESNSVNNNQKSKLVLTKKNKYQNYNINFYKNNGYNNSFIGLYKNGYKNLLQNAFPEKRTITLTYEEIKRRIQKVITNATFKINCKNKELNEIYFFLDKNLHLSPKSRFKNLCDTATIIFK